jgi:AcrR family transcriptional regulator
VNDGSPARLRSQIRETVRAEILNATEVLIAEHGLHGTSLAAIARRAGVAVGTLYNYFDDRDAMITALFEERRSTLRPKIREAIQASKGLAFEPRLYALIRGLLAAMDTHRLFVKVALETEYGKRVPSEAHSDLRAALDQVMQAGVAEKQIRRDQAELAAAVLQGAIKAAILRRAQAGEPCADDADAIAAMFLDGARTRGK